MDIRLKDLPEVDSVCDVLILPAFEGEINKNILPHNISQIIEKNYNLFKGKHSELLLIPSTNYIKPKSILMTGLGKKSEINLEKIRQAGGKCLTFLKGKNVKTVAISSRLFSDINISPSYFIEGILLSNYRFKKYKRQYEKEEDTNIEDLILLSKYSRELNNELYYIKILTSAVHFTRDLVNTPANDMTPKKLSDVAKSLSKNNISVKVMEKGECDKLGLNLFLSVSRGSKEQPKFIVLHYKGKNTPPLILIGKSITFDSGGISLKPSDGMDKMKYDMAGGAAVLGIFKAVSELNLPINLIGILPATENLPGGSATRPGDIVTSLDGKTVEIENTDAEGRLTLADAISYAKRFKPKAIIDIATLTGACSVALGNEAIAMMGNDRDLIERLKRSGEETHERTWEMPLFNEYKEYIKSDTADLKNTGGRTGSLVTSGYFLYEFAEKTPWVHLDIASTAWVDKDKPYIPKGATGIGVRLILNFLKELEC
jgi:leucyl aminopeptidase